jgi:prepilin-type N-terminal cleavage/methylation domain-containing protein
MKSQDEGFTLIELLITIAIMGVVFSSVTAIAVVVLNSKREADQALRNSSDLQMMATYFADDGAGATSGAVTSQPNPLRPDLLGVLTLTGSDYSAAAPWPLIPWSHIYRLNTVTHEMTRDDTPVATNIYSASFATGATGWSLTVDGCVLPACATATGAPTTITATRRIP